MVGVNSCNSNWLLVGVPREVVIYSAECGFVLLYKRVLGRDLNVSVVLPFIRSVLESG